MTAYQRIDHLAGALDQRLPGWALSMLEPLFYGLGLAAGLLDIAWKRWRA